MALRTPLRATPLDRRASGPEIGLEIPAPLPTPPGDNRLADLLRVRAFLDQAPCPLLAWEHPSGRLTTVNQALARLLDSVSEDAVARSIYDLLPAGDHERLAALCGTTERDTSQDAAMCTVLRGANGSRLPVELTVNRVTIGNTVHSVAAVRPGAPADSPSPQDQNTEHLAQAALNALATHVTVLDEAGTVIALNQAWREPNLVRSPLPEKVAVGDDFLATCDRAVQSGAAHLIEFTTRIRETLNGGRHSFSLDYANHLPSGRRWFTTRGTRFSASGTARIVITHEDITERKLAEETLCQGEERFRALFETMAQGVIYQDSNGVIVAANLAAEKILGIPRDQLLNRTSAYHGWRTVHEDGSDFPGEQHPTMLALRTGTPVHDVVMGVFNQTDSAYRWILVSAVPEYRPGQHAPFRVYATFSDITERKRAAAALQRSEEKYATAFRASPDAVTITSIDDGRFIEANAGFERITGYRPADIIGRSTRDLGLWVDWDERETLFRMLKAAGRVRNFEWQCRVKSGELRNVQTAADIIEIDGRTHLLCVTRDITERKLAELERSRLEAQLRHAQKMEAVGQLAGGVAHDFNNTLTAILGSVELSLGALEGELPAPLLGQGLRQIERSAQRATRLTRQLLAFSRRQATSPELLDFNHTLGEMERMLRWLVTENIELATQLAPDLYPIHADTGQIEQVVMNLIVNARDAMPEGGKITIETANVTLDDAYVATHAEAQRGPHVCLTIADTGSGMDAQTVEHCFEPFFTTKAIGEGTGLGLAMVYGIVKQAGGHIMAYSELGLGTTFRIYLPAVQTDHRTLPLEDGADACPTGTETILLCEDDNTVRHLTAQLLENSGYTVLMAEGGTRALQIASNHSDPIHLLITDVVMPDMNGRQVSEALRDNRPSLKTLFISGYTSSIIAHYGVLDKAAQFLEKPFTRSTLLHRVRHVLDIETTQRDTSAS